MYVIRVKYEDSDGWHYLGGVWVGNTRRTELGQKYELKDFFMTLEKADEKFRMYLKIPMGLEAIALVECNSDYIPFTEHKVIRYREF